MKYLVSGIDSGLGRYLYEQLSEMYEVWGYGKYKGREVGGLTCDTIIHCAFQHKLSPDYWEKNLGEVKRLLKIPHERFILMSTVDIYTKDYQNTSLEFSVEDCKNIYVACKLAMENLVRLHSKNYNIIRASAMLGPYMKPNTFYKLQYGLPITVTEDSTFSFITYNTVLEHILKRPTWIVNNLCAKNTISVKDLRQILDSQSDKGKFRYITHKLVPAGYNAKTSEENINDYLQNVNNYSYSQTQYR